MTIISLLVYKQNKTKTTYHHATIQTHHLLPLPSRRMARTKLCQHEEDRPFSTSRSILQSLLASIDSNDVCARMSYFCVQWGVSLCEDGDGAEKSGWGIVLANCKKRRSGMSYPPLLK